MDSQPGLARPGGQTVVVYLTWNMLRKVGASRSAASYQIGRPRLGVVLAAIFVQCVVKILPMQEENEIPQYPTMKYSEGLCPCIVELMQTFPAL
jgi:hypothetical protein